MAWEGQEGAEKPLLAPGALLVDSGAVLHSAKGSVQLGLSSLCILGQWLTDSLLARLGIGHLRLGSQVVGRSGRGSVQGGASWPPPLGFWAGPWLTSAHGCECVHVWEGELAVGGAMSDGGVLIAGPTGQAPG